MPDTEGVKKETAILELTEELNKSLEDLQARLDASFERGPTPTAVEEAKPAIPNVLDEINENLCSAIGKVQRMHEFVIHAVIHKVHNV